MNLTRSSFRFNTCNIYKIILHYSTDNYPPESTSWTKDLKSIFALLIRQYDSNIQVIEYLYDLIVTNHMVLSLFDNFKDCWNLNDGITAHIKK